MQITKDQVEWAVILRLRDMLRASPQAEHDVTQAFALFSSIVCWIAQRMRTKGSGPNDLAARRFYERMKTEGFGQFGHGEPRNTQSVADAIVLIRNAVAHADGSSVEPLCRTPAGSQPKLVGYAVQSAKDNKIVATLALTPDMMIRFGMWIADEFIADMTRDDTQKPRPIWAEEVNRGAKEARR